MKQKHGFLQVKINDHEKRKSLEKLGISIFETSSKDSVNPIDVAEHLGEKGISSVFIEGGGNINAAFLENKLIDKVVLYFAPKLIGGKDAPSFLEGTGINEMKDAVELIDTDISRIGPDFKFTGYPIYKDDKK